MTELGQTTDPKALIPGNVAAIEENIRVLRGRANAVSKAGEGLRAIDTGAWTGEAAKRFADKFSHEPTRWLEAGDSLSAAADALQNYVGTLRWAKEQADEAVRRWTTGSTATAIAEDEHDEALAKVNAQNLANASMGQPTCATAPPFVDPGAGDKQAAQSILKEAKLQLATVGAETAAILKKHADIAPEDSNWLEDSIDVVGDFAVDFAVGAWDTISGIGETVWDIVPIQALWDAEGYVDGLATMAQNTWNLLTDPDVFQQHIDDMTKLAKEDPGRLAGQIAAGAGIGRLAKFIHDKKGKNGLTPENPIAGVDLRLSHLDEKTRNIVKETIERAAINKQRFQGNDNKTFDNYKKTLPIKESGYYIEWTVAESGQKRGAQRLVFGGDPAQPEAVYYSPDHYLTFIKVYP